MFVEKCGRIDVLALFMPHHRARSVGIISEEEARAVLREHHDAFFRVITRAFERCRRHALPLTKIPRLGHLTNAMHALMCEGATDRLSGSDDIELIDEQTFLVKVGGRALVRLKKVSAELKTSNYPTPRATDLDAQLHVEGLPPLPLITIGYEPDKLWEELLSVPVLFSVRKQVRWNYELTGKSENVHALSPLVDEVIVKPKKQMTLDDLLNAKKPR